MFQALHRNRNIAKIVFVSFGNARLDCYALARRRHNPLVYGGGWDESLKLSEETDPADYSAFYFASYVTIALTFSCISSFLTQRNINKDMMGDSRRQMPNLLLLW